MGVEKVRRVPAWVPGGAWGEGGKVEGAEQAGEQERYVRGWSGGEERKWRRSLEEQKELKKEQ
jgi:hypothetical protein